MLHTALSNLTLVTLFVVWVALARRRVPYLRTYSTFLVAASLIIGAGAVITGSWFVVLPALLGVIFAMLMRAAATQLVVDRYPSSSHRDTLTALGGHVAAGGEGSPIVGELWEFPTGLFLVAALDDDDHELEMWVRSVQPALRSASDSVTLLMVSEDATEQQRTILGSDVHITTPDGIRNAVTGNTNRAQRRRR